MTRKLCRHGSVVQHIFYLVLNLVLLCRCGGEGLLNPQHCGLLPFSSTSNRFLVLGANDPPGKGLGNMMIFFPSAYYYAALTSRFVVVADHSYLGHFCAVVKCGFPLLSQIQPLYPDIFSEENLGQMKTFHVMGFLKMFETGQHVQDTLLTVSGYDSKSSWWVLYNHTAHCVSKLSGCHVGDVACADRFAFQQLVTGPFQSAGETELQQFEQRILGIRQTWKRALFTLPHRYVQRFDVAIHLRNQFIHFENEFDVNHPDYKKEVDAWLADFESKLVFQFMHQRLKTVLETLRPLVKSTSHWYDKDKKRSNLRAAQHRNKASDRAVKPIYVYLAADNHQVKEALKNHISNDQALMNAYQVMFVTLDTSAVYHVKNMEQMKSKTGGKGMFDLVFDWYALSLSNEILAWRQGGTRSFSTFITSAQRMSGTKEYSTDVLANNASVAAEFGKGVGSKAHILVKLKSGDFKFEPLHVQPYFPELDSQKKLWTDFMREAEVDYSKLQASEKGVHKSNIFLEEDIDAVNSTSRGSS